MSIQRIRQYQSAVDRAKRHSGSRNEQTIRTAFYNLLNDYAHQQNLELATEVEFRPKNHPLVYPDGTLMDALQQPRRIPLREAFMNGINGAIRVQSGHRMNGRLDLGAADIGGAVQHLPLQVRQRHHVVVHHP